MVRARTADAQEEDAGDVEGEVEAAPEGPVGGGDHLVDDVGDGGLLAVADLASL